MDKITYDSADFIPHPSWRDDCIALYVGTIVSCDDAWYADMGNDRFLSYYMRYPNCFPKKIQKNNLIFGYGYQDFSSSVSDSILIWNGRAEVKKKVIKTYLVDMGGYYSTREVECEI